MIPLLAFAPLRPADEIRVVACDAPVQSRKRGVCANRLAEPDFVALAPGVSWYYDWHFTTRDVPPPGVAMEFLPMAWGDRPEDLAGLDAYLADHRPRRVLALNEPNLKGQAFLSPQRSAAFLDRVKAIADRHGVPVVGPQMAIGSAKDDSVTAVDPIDKRSTTYTFMVPFLKAVFAFGATTIPAVGLHTYGNLGETRWALETMRKEFGRPIWVTEYSHAPNAKEGLAYLMQATDLFERSPDVEGYAWFKERSSGSDAAISLLQATPGRLTALGEAYVAMPVHDDDLYYRIPGRLQAERYAAMAGAEIFPTTDEDGLAQMTAQKPDATLEYHLQVDSAGLYTLRFRVAGPVGRLAILEGGGVVGGVDVPPGGGWRTVSTTLRLPSGPQTLRIDLGAKSQAVNWIEFLR